LIMQPNSNRPVFIVRPTVIPTGAPGQMTPVGAQLHPLSTVRTPMQPRPMISSPVYTSMSSPQQAPTRLIKPDPGVRLPMRSSLPTNISTPPLATATAAAATTAATTMSNTGASASTSSKDIVIRLMKNEALYGVMEFASGIIMDVKDGNSISLEREINPFTYRPPTGVDPNANSSSNTITTSLGVVLPKTGAGSEYGREQKEAFKRKRYASKGTNLEDLPWLMTNRIANEKKPKYFRGMKKGGIASNSAYYIFTQTKDGFDAYPVNEWYSFTPTNVYKPVDFDEAEKLYLERDKKLSKWAQTSRPTKEKDPDAEDEENEGGKKSTSKKRSDLQILDIDEFKREAEDEESEDDGDDDENGGPKKKKSKKSKNSGPTLSDDDDDADERSKVNMKKKQPNKNTSERPGEDSDDGDHDHEEVDYTSDETSEEEDDLRDANTLKTSMKYEVKGIDEEMKPTLNIEKKLDKMDEDGLDFDDDDEEIEVSEPEENEDENAADDLGDVSKLKTDQMNKDLESSSDDDDLDDSDDPEKESVETAASNTRPNPAEQILTEKGHKKARDEVMRDIKSKVISLSKSSAIPASPADAITDESVRNLLSQRKQMTFKELIQKFLPKANDRTDEIKKTIVDRLAAILKRLNIEHVEIGGKKYIRIKN